MRQPGQGLAHRIVALSLIGLTAGAMPAQACTNFLLKAADGSPVSGRTLEYALEVPSDVVVVPRNYDYVGTRPADAPNVKWTSRYGIVGVMSFGQPFVSDGMNEKGLAGGALYFPGYVGYTAPKDAGTRTALAPWEFLTWVLTNFATVEEVKAALQQAAIIDLPAPMVNFTLPFHFPIHDASGASIVIEPVDGKFKVYDNPLGVLTNSPSFDWHLANVRNYVKISPVDAPSLNIAGQTFTPFGQGSGLLGIPGDPTPPSRFIRALGYVASAKQQADGPATVRVAEHILNSFDIPAGFISTDAKGDDLEFTQWTSIADLRARKYYIKSYEDQVLRVIDLTSFDLDVKALRVAPFKPNQPPLALEFNPES
jgi:choloylglycine hydrolase